jgi:hypothetical protein
MYLRITRGTFDPSAADAVAALVAETNAAVARLPGHDHTHQGLDRADGRVGIVTTWDTEEHARFSRDQLGDLITRVQAAGVTLEPPEVYELVGG